MYDHKYYLNIFRRELVIRKYSQKTIRNYMYIVRNFLLTTKKDPRTIRPEYLKNYVYRKCDQSYSSNTIALIINGLKAFFRLSTKTNVADDLHHPKRSKSLPYILENSEIHHICSSITNRKHRCMIALMYSSGLRVSEVVHVKVQDIDFTNLRLIVRKGKGNKHRVTIFSPKLLDAFCAFSNGKEPDEYLFTTRSNKPYSPRTLQAILEKGLIRSHIPKHASCHILRHSFATHLLEDGVNIVAIQKLLGHANVKTTMIYTKLARHALKDIKSPL
ncbi:MAG TPA: hypothetical protein ENN69_07000 [Spirochaetia bacterium]|nr:hypothetical protein [Spirochaetia bacterium]